MHVLRTPLPDAPDPHEAHARLAARFGTTFILESREGPARQARYSIVGFDPAGRVVLDRDGLHASGALPDPDGEPDPLTYLRRVQASHAVAAQDLPFAGGLVGSLGYDLARLVEPSLDRGAPEAWPRLLMGLYLDGLVYDHKEGTVEYVSRGEDRSRTVREALTASEGRRPLTVGPVQADTPPARFLASVRRAQDLIRAGECFQIVLSRAFSAQHHGDLVDLYDWLREREAVPYLYHLRFDADTAGGRELVGASPEGLVRVRSGRAETFPIAGTRPLTGDAARDEALGRELRGDRKETAEHAMLVDLARNDLSRVCEPGTVAVEAYQELHRFRTVQHLVSRVTGDLAPGKDALSALAAVFPAGTVSGAPKLRAMEHIDALEQVPRGPYAGAVAYWSLNGDFDSAIAIRTLSRSGDRLTVQAGAGIVLRSDPDAELAETRHKSGSLLDGLAAFGARVPADLEVAH